MVGQITDLIAKSYSPVMHTSDSISFPLTASENLQHTEMPTGLTHSLHRTLLPVADILMNLDKNLEALPQ